MNDKTSPLYWFDKPLMYSDHAVMRSFERYIPIINFLPLYAKYEGDKRGSQCFTYYNQIGKVLIVLCGSGTVVTTYYMKPDTKHKIKTKPRIIKPSKYPHKEIEFAMYEYA